MTNLSLAQKTPAKKSTLNQKINSSEIRQDNNSVLIITSPTDNQQVKSPLVVKGNADRNSVIEVNVNLTYSGGSQDLGTFEVNTTKDGSWATIPINLWMPEGAKNVQFNITASIAQGDKTYTTKIVSVRPPQKVPTIPQSEIKKENIIKMNPSALQKSKLKAINTGNVIRSGNTKKSNDMVVANNTQVITQVKPKVKFEKQYFKAKDFVKAAQRLRLRTVNSSNTSGDNSTITVTKKEKGDEFCTDVTLNTKIETSQFKDFTIGDGPPDWMKPGIILSVSDFIEGGAKIEERYDRGPITIYNTTFASKPPQRVNNPKDRSAIKDALDNLVSTKTTTLHAANIHYSYNEIRNEDEFNIHVNGRYSKGFNTFAAHFGVDNSSKKDYHYYLVEFTQILFSVEVDGLDPNNIFPNNPEVNLNDYIYISKVNYGRKGYFMFKSKKSLDQLGVNAGVTASYLSNNLSIESNLEKISQTEDVEIKAFYWGGTISSAIDDLIADRNSADWVPLKVFMQGHRFTEAESFPISYQIKNLNNDLVALSSTNKHNVETCVPLEKDLHLKVTLLQLQAQATRYGSMAHYGITQHIRYKANGAWKKEIKNKSEFRMFPNRTDCDRGGRNNKLSEHIPLICGNKNNQIHVGVTENITDYRNDNINNSIVFKITPEEANDKNAFFEIDTWVKEYSDTEYLSRNDDLELLHGSREKNVAIHDVLSILLTKNFNAGDHYNAQAFGDGSVDQNLEFMTFDGVQLPLLYKSSGSRIYLEGPIRVRNRGGGVDEKGFVWMRFELVED